MQSVMFYGQEDLRVTEIDEPVPGHGEVKLRNAYAGICGSDLHIYYAPEDSGMDYTQPHPVTGAQLPQILGHEFAGEVVELGPGVDCVAVGDRVAVWPIYYCGDCGGCEQGVYNACSKITFHGVYSNGGGMAEYTTVTADRLHKLPDNIDLKMGSLVEPMAVAWHAVKRSGIKPGQSALIAGAGPIGIGVWFALRELGVENIVVSEPSPTRREAIGNLGARVIVDPINQELGVIVSENTNGRGVDHAFDASGASAVVPQAIAQLNARGRLTIIALHEKPIQFNPTSLVMGEKEIIGVLGYGQDDFDEVIAAMGRGRYDMTGWVEEVEPSNVADAFGRLRAGQGMKILVRPTK